MAAAVAMSACDPGWHYRAAHGTPVQLEGLRYDVPSPAGLKARVYASAFTSSLDVELTLTNTGAAPVELTSPQLRAIDGRGGGELPRSWPAKTTCHSAR